MFASRGIIRRAMSSGPTFKRVGVVGLGLMGHGVAQIVAASGYDVVAIESNQEALDRGFKRIEDSLGKIISKDVQKGKLTEPDGQKKYQDIIGRITKSTSLDDSKGCDLIIEAIAENMELKMHFYTALGKIADNHTVFASNTSSLPITNMSIASGRPDKFVGLHFFNPVQMMKLVEVIRTEHTNTAVFDAVSAFGKSIGKTTVSCQDTPGFIVNRLLVPYLSQAMAMVDRNVASVADIDVSMQLGAGHPMGPLHLADYIGLDTILHILVGWKKDFPSESAFIIPTCLENLVKNGHYGRKSGRGFYYWDGDKIGKPV